MAAELTGRLTTSAHTTWTSLRWLESHLVFVFHTAAPSVKAWSAVGDQGEVCQAVPLSCRQWLLIETRALESGGLHRQLLADGVSCFTRMVRFELLQHSDIWIESGLLADLAKHGKMRRHSGRRPPSLAGLVRGTHGLVSAFVACCPWGCKAWLLLGALRGTNISTYSARRVLPSIADVLLSSTDRASLGTWAGSTAASLARPTPLRLAMPLRYSAVRSSSALIV